MEAFISIKEMGSKVPLKSQKQEDQPSGMPSQTEGILENAKLVFFPKTQIQHQHYALLLNYIIKRLGELPSTELHEIAYNLIQNAEKTSLELFGSEDVAAIEKLTSFLTTNEGKDEDLGIVEDAGELDDEVLGEIQIDVMQQLASHLSVFPDAIKQSVYDTINSSEVVSLESNLVKLFDFKHTDIIIFILENCTKIKQQLSAHSLQIIDLEEFDVKHQPIIRECKLPSGSFKRVKQGYEEIHIPMNPPHKNKTKLISISTLPEWCQPCFINLSRLNTIQSTTFSASFESDHNMLISAPTGAGKTNLALLAMLRCVSNYQSLNDVKIVYVAPLKALVQELVHSFSIKLKPLNMAVGELTGDTAMTKQQLQATHLIITTPEKWDVVSRKGMNNSVMTSIKLMIVDEIHLIHDPRGPAIESIIARSMPYMRLIGLSATLPNYQQVGEWLQCPQSHIFNFDQSYRPCPLAQEFIGISTSSFKKYQLQNQITYTKVMEDAGEYQCIVFVHSRKETWKTANALIEMGIEQSSLDQFQLAQDSLDILKQMSTQCTNKHLQQLLPHGFGIHHAGLSREDRTLVEDLFADKHIQVLVATSTLSIGINLPSHTCIIKGTSIYSPEKGTYIDLGHAQLLQMIGRAGRPGFDEFGRGIVITFSNLLSHYTSIVNHQFPIQSQLAKQIVDCMNAEIILGINSIDSGIQWVKKTWFYASLKLEDHMLKQIVHSCFTLLNDCKMAMYDYPNVYPTELGRIASYFYINYESIAYYYSNIKSSNSILNVLECFSHSSEFKHLPNRVEEQQELGRLEQLVPIPTSLKNNELKITILLQCYISHISLNGFQLQSDLLYIKQSATRLFKAISECALYFKYFQPFSIALELSLSIQSGWSIHPLNQIHFVPLKLLRKVNLLGISFHRLAKLKNEQLSELLMEDASLVYSAIQKYPKYTIEVGIKPLTSLWYSCQLDISKNFIVDLTIHYPIEQCYLVVTDALEENILYSELITLSLDKETNKHSFIFESQPLEYCLCHLISTRFFTVQPPVSIKVTDPSTVATKLDFYQEISNPNQHLEFLLSQPHHQVLSLPFRYHRQVLQQVTSQSLVIVNHPILMDLPCPIVTPKQIDPTNSHDLIIAMHIDHIDAYYEVLLMQLASLSTKIIILTHPIVNYRDFCHLLQADPTFSMSICDSVDVNHVFQLSLQPGLTITNTVKESIDYLINTQVFIEQQPTFTNDLLQTAFCHNALFCDSTLSNQDLMLVLSHIPKVDYIVIDPYFMYAYFPPFEQVTCFCKYVNIAALHGKKLIVQGDPNTIDKQLQGFPIESRLYLHPHYLLHLISPPSIELLLPIVSKSLLSVRCSRNKTYYTTKSINEYVSECLEGLFEDLTELELINSPLLKIMQFYKLTVDEMDIILSNLTSTTQKKKLMELLPYLSFQFGSPSLNTSNIWLQQEILLKLNALISICHYHGYIKPLISCIELQQICHTRVIDMDPIKQLPHYEWIKDCKSVYELMEMEDDERERALERCTMEQKSDIADFVNNYPNLDIQVTSSSISIENDDDIQVGPLWIIIGDTELDFIKKVDELPATIYTDLKGKLSILVEKFIGCDQLLEK